MLATYIATCLGFAILLIQSNHFESAGSVFGAQYSFGLFLFPNTLSFAISAWIMRARWSRLSPPQLVAAGFSLSILTIAVLFGVFALILPFLNHPALIEVGARVAMVAPGVIAAQFLRFSARSRTSLA